MSEHDDFEPHHTSSPTDHLLQELQLYGYRPFENEPDPRPLPEATRVTGAIADIFDALIATLMDTRLEPDLDDLLWSNRQSLPPRLPPDLNAIWTITSKDSAAFSANRRQRCEVRRTGALTAEGQTHLESPRSAFELIRYQAADHFERHTGSSWRPPHRIDAQPSQSYRSDDRQPRLPGSQTSH